MQHRLLVCTLALALVPLLGGPAGAQPCSHRAIIIEGVPVDVTLCVGSTATPPSSSKVVRVGVDEELKSSKGSVSRSATLEFVAGVGTSRTIDEVALDRLFAGKTLHMTLAWKDGTVTLEHAMLLPGAVPVI